MPRTSYHAASSLVAILRQNLGLSQLEVGRYLGVSRAVVAQEVTPGRSLPRAAGHHLDRLFYLAPWLAVAPAPLPYPGPDDPPTVPPVAAAVLPFPADAAQVQTVSRAAQALRWRLYKARYAHRTTAEALALLARRQRAVADITAPPAANIPADAHPTGTAFLLKRLRDYVADDTATHSPLHPAAVAYDRLRWHLLETEAATLAAWLAVAG